MDLKIEKMYAFISEDENGQEGVCGAYLGQWMPLVGADLARVKDLMPIAQDIANKTGREIKLIYFSERTDVEVIKPI